MSSSQISQVTRAAIEDAASLPSEAEHRTTAEDDLSVQHLFAQRITAFQRSFLKLWIAHRAVMLRVGLILLAILYLIYFGFALHYSVKENIGLIVLTVLAAAFINCRLLAKRITSVAKRCCSPLKPHAKRAWKYGKWVMWTGCALACIVIVAVFSSRDVRSLASAGGTFAYILIMFIFSKNPAKAEWRVLFGGLIIQFILGLVIMRFQYGAMAFKFIGDQMTTFLVHGNAGAEFVFGPEEALHALVMVVLPTAIYFGAFIEICYYFGVLQYAIKKFGYVMDLVMSVGAAEAFVAAANVFLGPTSSVLTVAPLLTDMSLAQLHCVMTSGFSSVTGSLLGIYISFGVPATYLITASVMSAPAALATSRMMYPSTEKLQAGASQKVNFPKTESHSPFHAVIVGAGRGIGVVVHVTMNLLAFVAIFAFLNAMLTWLGNRVGIEGLSFELVMSYVFLPLSYAMGVESSDAFEVSRLIGIRLFLTEIVGYKELGILIKNREAGLTPALSPRSEVIAAFALCGFGTFLDIGINIGAMGALAPSKKGALARVAFRAMVAGNIACYMTACIAGILYVE